MRALSIRQPYAELILRGIKTAEFRSRPTSIIGEGFLIYASKGRSKKPGASLRRAQSSRSQKGIWSTDLSTTGGTPMPQWMVELAEQIKLIPEDLEPPTGVIVGSAIIDKVTPIENSEFGTKSLLYAWHLTDVVQAATLRKPPLALPPA